MKRLLCISFGLFLGGQVSLSQSIMNGGLERWQSFSGYEMPDSFYTSSQMLYPTFGISTVGKSTDAHSGQYAARLQTESGPGSSVFAGTLGYGNIQMTEKGNYFWGWPFTGRPTRLTFWYKYSPAGNDTAYAIVTLSKWAGTYTMVGLGRLFLSGNTPSYTLGVISIDYFSSGAPDSVYVVFISSGNTSPTAGTVLSVDDINLDYATGVNDGWPLAASDFALCANYPNPFNPTTAISYRLAAVSLVSLKVYDLLGREIATLVNEVKLPGEYTVRFDGSHLTSGAYFCRMHAGTFVQTKKMILIK